MGTLSRRVVAAVTLCLATAGLVAARPQPQTAETELVRQVENALLVARSKSGADITAMLAARMAEARVPAVSIAFIDRGRIAWTRVYGEAQAGVPAGVSTRFQAASLSKAVSAAGALRMVDRRQLSLGGDINASLRGWKLPAGQAVTLRHLLSHTAGLTVAGYPGYRRGVPVPTIAQSLAGAPPANTLAIRRFAQPGEQFAYSGGGFSVVELAMSERAGLAFGPLLTRLVLRPVGMTASSFEQGSSSGAGPARAAGHDPQGKIIPGGSYIHPELAAAGLWTTPSDYARLLIALQRSWNGERGALLSRESASAMLRPALPGHGLGVVAQDRGGRTAITHSGSNEGFRSFFLAFLDGRREGVVIMTNGDNGGRLAAEIARTIGRASGWAEPAPVRMDRAPD